MHQRVPARRDVRMLGAMPELDSMSVVAMLETIEEHYDVMIHDDEVDAAVFESLGTLVDFVREKVG